MKQFCIGIIIATIIAFLDQWSKFAIFAMLLEKPENMLQVTSFFNLVMVHNFGVSFGMFHDIPHGSLVLTIIALAISAVLLVWMWRERKIYMSLSLGLIIGGAVGNIIDRARYGAVADFLDFHIAGYHWPAFNLADSAVFVGVALLLLEGFFVKKGRENASK